MKTKLIILALALTCLGSESPPTMTGRMIVKEGVVWSPPLTQAQPAWVSVMDSQSPPLKEIFRVTGIAILSGSSGSLGEMRYEAPEKPDDVKATLVTKDGKRWHAQWVEDKP